MHSHTHKQQNELKLIPNFNQHHLLVTLDNAPYHILKKARNVHAI